MSGNTGEPVYRIGIDVGGTFTDLVAVERSGNTCFLKVSSTPEDQSRGVMQGLQRLADRLQRPLSQLLSRTERMVHGMTVATNALLEGKGAKVGLLTTRGHRDVLEMREGLKPERYDLRMPRLPPLVPRHRRLAVDERVRPDGAVETPLDEASVLRAIRRLERDEVESVAVCYLHAYANPEHEARTGELLARHLPATQVSLSSQVLPRIKEYERISTTVVNAYVGPLIQHYLESLEQRIGEAGYTGQLLVILSHGGVAPVREAVRIAAATVLSGPAGGVAGATRVAELCGTQDLIAFDMGGTSTDISLVSDGAAQRVADRNIANQRIALPSLDIVTLGAGGGSLATVDTGALLRVGPESAGADPGPACYARGGTGATVTDASVVLGYLDPQAFSGDLGALDPDAAHRAVAVTARDMGVSVVEAARGIHRVVNTHMAEGIRLATVRRGVDPRRFTLLGFGGAAGLHVTALARALELGRVLVPTVASVLSAWGMLATPLRLETMRSYMGETDELDMQALHELFRELERTARERMQGWTDAPLTAQPLADMRYGEQVYEIDVPLDGVDLEASGAREQIKEAFETRHRELYTYALPAQTPMLVNARLALSATLTPLPVDSPGGSAGVVAPRRRDIYLDEWRNVAVQDAATLHPGQVLTGPCLVESDTTTVLLGDGDEARIMDFGWLDIRLASPGRGGG